MTERKFTNRKYLDALEKKVLIFDGAMGTSLQERRNKFLAQYMEALRADEPVRNSGLS